MTLIQWHDKCRPSSGTRSATWWLKQTSDIMHDKKYCALSTTLKRCALKPRWGISRLETMRDKYRLDKGSSRVLKSWGFGRSGSGVIHVYPYETWMLVKFGVDRTPVERSTRLYDHSPKSCILLPYKKCLKMYLGRDMSLVAHTCVERGVSIVRRVS